MVEEILELGRARSLLQQVKEHARIESPRAGAHDQPVQCGEAHGRSDGAPLQDRGQAGALAQMRHYQARRHAAGDIRQPRHDGFIGNAVEPVAPETLGVEIGGQRQTAGLLGLGRMEGGVEAGDLRHPRRPRRERPDRGDVVRLMQRCEGDQSRERVNQFAVDAPGLYEPRSAMDHPMAGAGKRSRVAFGLQPVEELSDRGFVVRDRPRLRQALARHGEARLVADAGDLAFETGLPALAERQVVESELDAG